MTATGAAIWLTEDVGLTLVPVALGYVIARGLERDLRGGRAPRWLLWAPLLLMWLLFLPNTAYLLTEWRHLYTLLGGHPLLLGVFRGRNFPPLSTLQFAICAAFYLALTGAGPVTLYLSIRPLEQALSPVLRPGRRIFLQALVFLLTSVGVYFGFALKLNSWQIGARWVLESIARGFWTIVSQPCLAAVVVGFGVFLWGIYRVLVLIERGIAVRGGATGL